MRFFNERRKSIVVRIGTILCMVFLAGTFFLLFDDVSLNAQTVIHNVPQINLGALRFSLEKEILAHVSGPIAVFDQGFLRYMLALIFFVLSEQAGQQGFHVPPGTPPLFQSQILTVGFWDGMLAILNSRYQLVHKQYIGVGAFDIVPVITPKKGGGGFTLGYAISRTFQDGLPIYTLGQHNILPTELTQILNVPAGGTGGVYIPNISDSPQMMPFLNKYTAPIIALLLAETPFPDNIMGWLIVNNFDGNVYVFEQKNDGIFDIDPIQVIPVGPGLLKNSIVSMPIGGIPGFGFVPAVFFGEESPIYVYGPRDDDHNIKEFREAGFVESGVGTTEISQRILPSGILGGGLRLGDVTATTFFDDFSGGEFLVTNLFSSDQPGIYAADFAMVRPNVIFKKSQSIPNNGAGGSADIGPAYAFGGFWNNDDIHIGVSDILGGGVDTYQIVNVGSSVIDVEPTLRAYSFHDPQSSSYGPVHNYTQLVPTEFGSDGVSIHSAYLATTCTIDGAPCVQNPLDVFFISSVIDTRLETQKNLLVEWLIDYVFDDGSSDEVWKVFFKFAGAECSNGGMTLGDCEDEDQSFWQERFMTQDRIELSTRNGMQPLVSSGDDGRYMRYMLIFEPTGSGDTSDVSLFPIVEMIIISGEDHSGTFKHLVIHGGLGICFIGSAFFDDELIPVCAPIFASELPSPLPPEDTVPSPVLLSPANEMTTQDSSGTITFQWNVPPALIHFDMFRFVMVSQESWQFHPAFPPPPLVKPFVVDVMIHATTYPYTYSIPISNLQPGKYYWWSVAVRRSTTQTWSPFATPRWFFVNF